MSREVNSLVKAGYQVTVFAVGSPETLRIERDGNLKISRFIPKRLDNYNAFDPTAFKAYSAILQDDKEPYDVIHAHDSDTLFLAWLLARKWQARIVYDAHEFWGSLFEEKAAKLVEEKQKLDNKIVAKTLISIPGIWRMKYRAPKNSKRRIKIRKELFLLKLFQRFERHMLTRSDRLITVCDSINELMVANANPNGGKKPQCITLRNIANYTNVQKQRLIHQAYNLPPETNVIIYQGWVKPVRGISFLLDAMEHLDDGAALLLIGPAQQKYLAEVKERIENTPKLNGRVFYKDPVTPKALVAWTASADLGIHPILDCKANNKFCLPNKVFEYIQAEIPLAVSDLPEISKIVDGYGVGLTFNPENPQEVAEKIRDFFHTPGKRESFQDNLRAAKKELCWEKEEQKLLDLYKSLLY